MPDAKQLTILTISIAFADRECGRVRTVRWASIKDLTAAEFGAAAVEVEAALAEAGWSRSMPRQTLDQPLPAQPAMLSQERH